MKNKLKRVFAVVIATAALLTCGGVTAFADGNNSPEANCISEGVYEGDDLQSIASVLGYDLTTPDGYTLDRINVVLEKEDETDFEDDHPTARAIGDYISNVRKAASDVYFPSSPIASNWYDGPLSQLSKTYTRNVSATYNCTTSISTSTIDAGLSFSVTDSVSESTTWVRPAITSKQKINIKEFGVYDKYSFTVYSILGNEKGTGNAYKPMGLYITQATYSK